MNNAPYQGVANNLAQYGRYGDSMLVHMNPVEVQGLASLSPTGQLTTNPVTGQPEAFLPFLAPLLGSFLGSSLLTGAGAGVLGAAGLSSAAAGAIGSGLATTLATGDLEQGILSGITGFGLGQAFGAAGDALSKAGVDTATQAATDAISTGTQAAPDILSEGFQITPEGFVGQGVPTGTIAPDMGITTTPAAQLMQPSTSALTNLPTVASQAGGMGAAIQPAAPSLTPMQRLGAPLQEPGAFLSELAKPQNILPIYVGEGTGAQLRAEKAMEEGFQKQQEDQDAQRRADLMRTQSQMAGVFNQLRRDYPGIGYAQGGKVEGYFDGGDIENQIYNALRNSPYAGIPDPDVTQNELRGTRLVTPPTASYSALDVGGEGYMPGVAPEFRFFEKPLPLPEEDGATDPGSLPGGGNIVGGPFDPNFDLNALLGGFRGYQNYGDLFGGGAGQPPIKGDSTDFIDTSMERDVFAGGTPGFYDQDFSAITMDQFDPSRFQENLGTQPTPEAIQEQMNAPQNFGGGPLGRALNKMQTRMMDSGVPAQPSAAPSPDFQQIPPETNPFLAIRKEGFEDMPSNQPTLDLLRESFDRMTSQPSPMQGQDDSLNLWSGPVEPSIPQVSQPPAVPVSPPEMLGPLPPDMNSVVGQPPIRPLPEPMPSEFNSRLPLTDQEGIGAFKQPPPIQLPDRSMAMMDIPQMPEIPQMGDIAQMSTEELRQLSEMMNQGRFNALPFQEGGMVPEPGQLMEEMAPVDEMGAMQGEYEQLINMTVAAIRGEVENPEQVIRAFVEEFGNDAFMQLREAVLQEVVPGAQTEGMVEGMGGGQDDMVPGMIGTQRPVAVSPGEYIIPADVVAMAGGGYSGNGADFFDGLVDDIRMKTMGTTEQVRPYQERLQ